MRNAVPVSDSKYSQPLVPEYYQWKVAGKPVSVQLHLKVIDRLETEIMKGYWSVPKRGAEVGGVLLGKRVSSGGLTVFVEDYEIIPCEHSRGPSFHLSERDRQKMEETIARWRFYPDKYVVGYFRSHTRDELFLEDDDGALINQYFADPSNVFLLIKPSPSKISVGGFFIWEDGQIHRESSYLEFPFSRSELLRANLAIADPAVGPEASAPAYPGPGKAQELAPEGLWERIAEVWRAAPARARKTIFFLFVAVVMLAAALKFGAVMNSGSAGASNGNSAFPALKIRQNGSYLQVAWDRGAPVVAAAQRAVLSITDGTYRKNLQLDESQLRSGSVAYLPVTNDVNFRIELLGPGKTVVESLRVVTPPQPLAELPLPIPGPAAPGAPAAKLKPESKAKPEYVKQASGNRPKSRRGVIDDGL